MPAKPRIAIPVPTSTDPEYNQKSWPQYASAVERAGGDPVQVPLTVNLSDIVNIANTCQGILLPGSPADVDPRKYGQDALEATAPADPAREAVDELLLEIAHNLSMPLLTICYGTQILNVWRGGTLVQDLAPMPVNHSAGGSVAIAHTVAVAPASLLASLLTPEEAPLQDGFLRLPVNSSHHQAIAIPGEGLRIVARSVQDGVIEAVEGSEAGCSTWNNSSGDDSEKDGTHFVIAVQWHPERSCEISPASRAIFDRFLYEASVWTRRPVLTSAI